MDDPRRLSGPGRLGPEAMAVLARPPADGLLADGSGDETLPDEPLAGLAARHGLRSTATSLAACLPAPALAAAVLHRRLRHGAQYLDLYRGAARPDLADPHTTAQRGRIYSSFRGNIGARRGIPTTRPSSSPGPRLLVHRTLPSGRIPGDGQQRLADQGDVLPRACLPLAYHGMVSCGRMLLSMIVLFGIVLVTGEPVTWYWLLLILVIALQTMFNLGAALILARMGTQVRDVSQLVPFLLRTWRYFCGVMYSIAACRCPSVVGQDRAGREPGRGVHHADPGRHYSPRSEEPSPEPGRTTGPGAPRTSRPTATRRCPRPTYWVAAVAWASARWPSALSTSGGRKRGTGAADRLPASAADPGCAQQFVDGVGDGRWGRSEVSRPSQLARTRSTANAPAAC